MKPQPRSIMTAERVRQFTQSRFNPIRTLTPELLSRALESFAQGYVRDAALIFQALEERDDQIRAVSAKRKKAVSRKTWEIAVTDDSPLALKQKQALEYFYNNLRATDALDLNRRGGVPLLIRQMMDAASKMYAAHEILLTPTRGGQLTATLNFVPLWFFENRTGRLRYLPGDGVLDGVELPENEWMVTCGDGLMIPCSVAYIYKTLSLRDWVIYNERHGMPGFLGRSSAAVGSDEWNKVVEAVESISAEWSGVVSGDDAIEVLDLKGAGANIPYPPLIERMDRAIACLWRGADLSTLSANNTGASVQGEETDILEADDVELISETLNEQLDRVALAYLFGPDAPMLAYFRLRPANKDTTEADIKIDEHLDKSGVRETKQARAERYGRTIADPKTPEEDLVQVQNAVAPTGFPPPQWMRGANEKADDDATGQFLAAARLRVVAGVRADLKPLAEAVARFLPALEGDGAVDPETIRAMEAFRDTELPALMAGEPAETVRAFQDAFGAAFLDGLAAPEASP